MGVLWFGLGSFLTFVVGSGLAVYTADYVEHAWGKGGSFQVLCLLSVPATLLLVVGFGLGAAIAKRFPSRAKASFLGGLSASSFIVLMWLASSSAGSGTSWALVFTLPFIGGIAPFLARGSGGQKVDRH
jgi:hypothetical protein